jgi:hypothetical protein
VFGDETRSTREDDRWDETFERFEHAAAFFLTAATAVLVFRDLAADLRRHWRGIRRTGDVRRRRLAKRSAS